VSLNYETTGIIVVDHGSRVVESNTLLERIARSFQTHSLYRIVEPAHMELAEPSIATAFSRCVRRGAELVVVSPFFLLPGKHWGQDIPDLTRAAAETHPSIRYLVTAPLGLHPILLDVIAAQIEQCVAHASGEGVECELCTNNEKCQFDVG
jgi:sirohydrochlorin ferrochelatase